MNTSNSKLLSILVIDDNPLELGLIKLVIQKNFPDVKILSLTRPPDWSTYFNTQMVDVIIVDYRLPEKNGLSVIQELRNYKPDIPAFLITALERDEIDQDVMKSGATDFIVKDRNYSNLISKLNNILLQRTVKDYQEKIFILSEIIEKFTDIIVMQINQEEKCLEVQGSPQKILGLNLEDLLVDEWKKYFYETFKSVVTYFKEKNEKVCPFSKYQLNVNDRFLDISIACLKKHSIYFLIIKI